MDTSQAEAGQKYEGTSVAAGVQPSEAQNEGQNVLFATDPPETSNVAVSGFKCQSKMLLWSKKTKMLLN